MGVTNYPAGTTGPGPAEPARRASDDDRSIGTLFAEISRDLSTLIRQEITLAKAEASQSANKAGKGVGLMVGALIAAQLFLIFLSVALWWALGEQIGRGWSALIVALVWAVIAVILVLVGRAELRKIRGLPQTADTVGKIPAALKGHEEENR